MNRIDLNDTLNNNKNLQIDAKNELLCNNIGEIINKTTNLIIKAIPIPYIAKQGLIITKDIIMGAFANKQGELGKVINNKIDNVHEFNKTLTSDEFKKDISKILNKTVRELEQQNIITENVKEILEITNKCIFSKQFKEVMDKFLVEKSYLANVIENAGINWNKAYLENNIGAMVKNEDFIKTNLNKVIYIKDIAQYGNEILNKHKLLRANDYKHLTPAEEDLCGKF